MIVYEPDYEIEYEPDYEPDFPGAFYCYQNEAVQDRMGRELFVECCTVGDLVVTSGKIVACDGLIPSLEPFAEIVQPGAYPVVLSLTQSNGRRPHVAGACASFS